MESVSKEHTASIFRLEIKHPKSGANVFTQETAVYQHSVGCRLTLTTRVEGKTTRVITV
jgi:hypothetical protein